MDNKILTAEQELKLRKPIDDRVGAIQKETAFIQRQRRMPRLPNTRRSWNRPGPWRQATKIK